MTGPDSLGMAFPTESTQGTKQEELAFWSQSQRRRGGGGDSASDRPCWFPDSGPKCSGHRDCGNCRGQKGGIADSKETITCIIGYIPLCGMPMIIGQGPFSKIGICESAVCSSVGSDCSARQLWEGPARLPLPMVDILWETSLARYCSGGGLGPGLD